ncbi:MAG: hypothetical protein ACJAS6_000243 [Rickettsiales bacterium]|jgi:hypothetical protein
MEISRLNVYRKFYFSNNLSGSNRFLNNKTSARRMLGNNLYVEKIKHKDKLYEGIHEPIIDENTWEKSQKSLGQNIDQNGVRLNKVSVPKSILTISPLLKGIVHCSLCGSKMIPTYTTKQSKRYRYYICQSKHSGSNDNCKVGRISANEIEELVIDKVLNLLKKPELIIHTIASKPDNLTESKIINAFKTIDKIWDELFSIEQARIVGLLIKKIDIAPNGVNIKIYKEGLEFIIS